MNKKILILVMSCALPYYRKKEESIRNTWAKPILDGEYENIDLWFFNSGSEDCHDSRRHRIFVDVEDRRSTTFQKLCKTLNYIDRHKDEFDDYDYVVRVNISSVLNIRLVQEFIEKLNDETQIWSATTFNQPWVAGHAPFVSGECYIFSRYLISVLRGFYNSNVEHFNKLEKDKNNSICDDGWITICFKNHFKDDFIDKLQTFGIVYEPFEKLLFEDLYKTHIVITFKTDDATYKVAEFDKSPGNEELDEIKRERITEIVNSSEVPENWYEYFKENILNKECRSSLFRVENSYCDKDFIVKRYREFVEKGISECDWNVREPNKNKIWKHD